MDPGIFSHEGRNGKKYGIQRYLWTQHIPPCWITKTHNCWNWALMPIHIRFLMTDDWWLMILGSSWRHLGAILGKSHCHSHFQINSSLKFDIYICTATIKCVSLLGLIFEEGAVQANNWITLCVTLLGWGAWKESIWKIFLHFSPKFHL